jgi:hypothetical protein
VIGGILAGVTGFLALPLLLAIVNLAWTTTPRQEPHQ